MSYLLGIDLGTTYTAAAVLRTRAGDTAAEPEMLGLGAHGSEMPSVVLDGEDGSLLVGDAAERRATVEPDRVAREFKRRIGDPTPVSLGTGALPAEELAATIVRHVVETAAAREGGLPERIALTHPASWGDHKLELLRSALGPALTGLGAPQVEFLAEPQAAAVCYAAAERVEPGSTIAVYDLGGGTFDSAVVREEPAAGFTLLGRPDGVEFLGGVDFDEVVFDHVRAGAADAFAGLDESDPAVWAAVARLRRECREAKEGLSADTEVSVPVWLGGAQTVVRLHRGEFEELIGPRIEDSVEALRRAVGSAGLDPAELSSVLLVGGSSRIPLVAQTVSERLGRPVAVDADPKNAIAKGAALAMRPRHAASWPAVDVPVQRPVPDESDTERTGPIATAAVFRDDAPTERFAAVALLEPQTRVAPVRPGFGDTSSYVTREAGPQRGPDNRARWLIGAGGLTGALALIAAVLFWPSSGMTLDGASARSIVPDAGAAPTTAPPVPGAPAAVAEPRQETTTDPVTGETTRSAAPAPAAVVPSVAPRVAPRVPAASTEPAPVVRDTPSQSAPKEEPPEEDPPKEVPTDSCKPTDGSAPPASCTVTPPAP